METHSQFNRALARIAVGAYDDAQDVRIAMMNRIRDIVRKKNEDIPFDQVEEEKEDNDYDSKYDDENLPDIVDEMVSEGKLSAREQKYLEDMLEAAATAEQLEDQYKSVMDITQVEPIYQKWLDNVYGVSSILTARLIYNFGYCEDFPKVSNLWSYSGMAPGQTRKKGEQLDYNPQSKTLAWLVADRMIMQGSRSRYKEEFYNPYKERQLDRMEKAESVDDWEVKQIETDGGASTIPATFEVVRRAADGPIFGEMLFKGTPPKSRGHADNRARRYLAKKFLKHYWAIARDIQGLEVPDEWVITHGGHEKRTDTFENPFYAKRELMG